jgi:hypothetical protein
MLTDELKQQILHYIVHPVDHPPSMRDRVNAFLLGKLGVTTYDQYWPIEWGGSFRWRFCFDELGKLVPPVGMQTPYETVRGHKMISVVVSRGGPFVTAESYIVRRHDDGGVAYAEERPISLKAIDLAREVAQRFGLTYLDAVELYDWKLDWDVADEAGIDLEVSEQPNGFALLFYEC